MNCTSTNGRVNIITPDTSTLFSMQDRVPIDSRDTSFREAMTGNWYNTSLSDTFFSSQNIDFLQNAIQHGVYRRSNKQYVVGRQDSDVLKIIMRSIFLQYSKNKSDDIKGQVETLNKLVLDYAVPQVYGSAQGYMKYKHDASTLVVPLSNPIMSKTNDKQLLLKKWF
tara:strand:+ start:150 stop:650 length:501 start_codon:yes stop_codon:yes gene_type:complete